MRVEAWSDISPHVVLVGQVKAQFLGRPALPALPAGPDPTAPAAWLRSDPGVARRLAPRQPSGPLSAPWPPTRRRPSPAAGGSVPRAPAPGGAGGQQGGFAAGTTSSSPGAAAKARCSSRCAPRRSPSPPGPGEAVRGAQLRVDSQGGHRTLLVIEAQSRPPRRRAVRSQWSGRGARPSALPGRAAAGPQDRCRTSTAAARPNRCTRSAGALAPIVMLQWS